MYTFKKSITINRSPQDVFEYATNLANDTQWQTGIESSEWTSNGPPGVGSTYKEVRNFLGRKLEAEIELTGWDPPNQVSEKSINGPIPFEFTNKFEAQGNGTLMTLKGEAELGGFFKLAEGLVGKQVEKQVESDLASLKLQLEVG